MPIGFGPGYYDADVAGHEWIKSKPPKNTVGLRVDVNVFDDAGASKAMTGYIWFSPATMLSSGRHPDGTPQRSMAERQLNALGYEGLFERAQDIGNGVDLRGNHTRVQLKNETYNDVARLKIAFFVESTGETGGGSQPASRDDVTALFEGVKAPVKEPAPPPGKDPVPF